MSKVWFITGAGSGIGAATARAALGAGDRVVATGRNPDKIRNALRGVASDRLAVVQLDVADAIQAKAAVDKAMEAFGRIDVLVNNAGYSLLGNFEELTTAEIDGLISTNLHGVVHVMRAVIPVTRKQRSGKIINVSSLAGIIGFKHCGAYSAAKFAVEGLSQSVAQEVAQFGIIVTAVAPGFFRTDLLDDQNARYGSSTIDDYAAEGSAKAMWSGYNGKQQGDPAKLGDALVKIAGMDNPPKQFLAGSDAVVQAQHEQHHLDQSDRAGRGHPGQPYEKLGLGSSDCAAEQPCGQFYEQQQRARFDAPAVVPKVLIRVARRPAVAMADFVAKDSLRRS
ncbi:MAG: SDR family oxidoreductase [Mesorhizobium sp.]|uniref:SDR family oxidoreductase n=1 Tax=Mesorhizobium sp. TaxID=1871066 RepID=UPI0012066127|nr:SDR family oxidoreductase [Mesorhizobium sp.]TIM12420.1 MAG: SDR family oxidoreductase [Mesorhizobium sp.]